MLKQGPKQKSLICLSFEAIEFPPVLFSPELAGQTLMLGMMSAKTTQQNSSFLQTQLSGEVVPYVSKEHSKYWISVPGVPPAKQWSLMLSQDSWVKNPVCWGLGGFQPGTPCAGAFSHQEPQVTFLPSSYSKAGGFRCQISLFRQEGIFCVEDLPVSGLGYPRVSSPADSTRTCPTAADFGSCSLL